MEISNQKRIELFWKKVDKNGPLWIPSLNEEYEKPSKCWMWIGAKDKKGYGNFTVAKGKTAKAHRFAFLLKYGWLLPHPYQIDHKCNNPSCVRHLMCIHGRKNNEKSNSPSAINKRKTKCKYGHIFSEDNIKRKNGRRICLTCEKGKGRI